MTVFVCKHNFGAPAAVFTQTPASQQEKNPKFKKRERKERERETLTKLKYTAAAAAVTAKDGPKESK